MFVTLDGIVTFAKPLQPENAEPPIRVTPSGITTSASLLQSLKAEAPMFVTLGGITTLTSSLQPLNAEAPRLVTGLPSSVEGTATAPAGLGEIASELDL